MREEKRKTKVAVDMEVEADYEKSIQEFADAMIEEHRDQKTSDFEPFEAYAEKVKAKFYSDADQFRSRFARGYSVLLEELEKELAEKNKKSSI
jgi:hypothetical protein